MPELAQEWTPPTDMRSITHLRRTLMGAAVAGLLVLSSCTATSTPSTSKFPGTGCPLFPANNVWHTKVSGLPVHPARPPTSPASGVGRAQGRLRLRRVGRRPDRHPLHGRRRRPARRAGRLRLGRRERRRAVPDPAQRPIEGGPDSDGDRHVLVVDRDACRLYETYDSHPNGDGSWDAGSGAVFDLRSNRLRPGRLDLGRRRRPADPRRARPLRRGRGRARSTTPSGSPSRRRRRPTSGRPGTRPGRAPTPTCPRWACACG